MNNYIVKLLTKLPELTILVSITLGSLIFIEIFATSGKVPVLFNLSSVDLVVISFILSSIIAVVSVIAGVGGGVIFTPLMLAFTSIDTLIIRSTGLIVAMFSGLVSTGPFMRQGLADIKLVFFGALPIIVGGMAGAFSAILLSKYLGFYGDAIVRLSLGIIMIFIASMFLFGGANNEYPTPKTKDAFAQKLRLRNTYWEKSLNKPIRYNVSHVRLGAFLFFIVGFTGGFFGLGGGWAVVPVLNLVMTVPLKISAASSGVLLALGNAAAIWPFINVGALIGVIAAPWMLGQVIGGIIGAHILSNISAKFVRTLLIGLLFFTSIKLIIRGAETIFGFNFPIL